MHLEVSLCSACLLYTILLLIKRYKLELCSQGCVKSTFLNGFRANCFTQQIAMIFLAELFRAGSWERVETPVMAVDQLTACLKGVLLDMEQVAMKLAQLNCAGAVDPEKAKSAALALAAAAAAVARDAALICSQLDDKGPDQRNGRPRR
jgi:hypothetical protein